MGYAPTAKRGEEREHPPNSVGVASDGGAVEISGEPLRAGPSGFHTGADAPTLPTAPVPVNDAVLPAGGALSENSDTSSDAAGVRRSKRPTYSSPAPATGKEGETRNQPRECAAA